MSTNIYQEDLHTDIFPKEKLVNRLIEEVVNVQQQIEKGNTEIIFNICGIEIWLDYQEKDIDIVV